MNSLPRHVRALAVNATPSILSRTGASHLPSSARLISTLTFEVAYPAERSKCPN